jgi:putative oxidoreductase
MNWLSRFASPLQSILRIVSGLLFLEHGTQKLLMFPPLPPEMLAMHVPDNAKPVLLAAGVIELVGGLLITLGFYSRWAAFIASGEMAIAYWGVHVLMRHSLFPAFNGGDPAVLYSLLFLFFAAAGPGPWAVNQK